MKKILILLLALFLLGISANAQVILNVYQKGGLVHQYEINNIDSLGFTNLPLIVVPDTLAATVFDIDGNGYHSVTIGTQVWLVENLKTTKYRDGTPIPNVTDPSQWGGLSTGAYCDYDNLVSNSKTYGRLYNWYAVSDSRNIAPTGWHVPTDAEWTTLINYLGGANVAGGKLRESGTLHWRITSTCATNESGFSALPSGQKGLGSCYDIRNSGVWWSTTENTITTAWHWDIYADNCQISRSDFQNKHFGFSVRCLKDY